MICNFISYSMGALPTVKHRCFGFFSMGEKAPPYSYKTYGAFPLFPPRGSEDLSVGMNVGML